MMNLLALCFFLTSITTASIFSPKPNPPPNTIVKEGHRVVVVEYDENGYQNTKISISPEQQHQNDVTNTLNDNNHKFHQNDFTNTINDAKHKISQNDITNTLNDAKHKIKQSASVLPNLGQGISFDSSQDSPHSSPSFDLNAPKELICDAYGKCKHKISNAMEKTRDAIHKKNEEAREVTNKATNKAKETFHDVNEYTKESMEKGKEIGETVKEHVVQNVTKARGVVSKIWGGESIESVMGVANLLGIGTAYGMCVWITFVSSYVLAKVMPRQQFAVVQSKIYPVYFRVMGYCLGVALLGHVLGHRKRLLNNKGEVLQGYNLLVSLLTVFVNSVYLEPRATKLMFERMKIEKEEGRGREDITTSPTKEHHQKSSRDPKKTSTTATESPTERTTTTERATEQDDLLRARIIKLNNKLKKLNSYSSILNIVNLMSLTWHLVYLAQRVHRTC